MNISFFSQYQGQRGEAATAPELFRDPADFADFDNDAAAGPGGEDAAAPELIDLSAEMKADEWTPLDLLVPTGFHARDWEGRPRRFVDGKDVGMVVAALRAPAGFPVPVRLSQVGAVVLTDEDGVLRRQAEIVERVVTFMTHPFPFYEIESLGRALQASGLHLCHARPPFVEDPAERLASLFDYGLLRKITMNTSNNEMKQLEEGLAARFYDDVPTVIDGRLEPRFGQRTQTTAVVGVIKSHQGHYLHPLGLQVRYALRPQQRTPLFFLSTGSYPVVSWYLRFAGGLPDQGVVRVELPRLYYDELPESERRRHVDLLSATLYQYRCRQEDYGRAAVSLQPIVRAEESLGALMQPMNRVISQFYRMSGL
jgi:hypothetical protein